jgi:hypothetical protein
MLKHIAIVLARTNGKPLLYRDILNYKQKLDRSIIRLDQLPLEYLQTPEECAMA